MVNHHIADFISVTEWLERLISEMTTHFMYSIHNNAYSTLVLLCSHFIHLSISSVHSSHA